MFNFKPPLWVRRNWRVQRREEDRYELGEETLRKLEEDFMFNDSDNSKAILARLHRANPPCFSYGDTARYQHDAKHQKK